RDEAPRSLRKALREEGPRKGRGRAPRAQARAQEAAARRPVTDEAEAGVRRGSRCRAWRGRRPWRSRWRFARRHALISALSSLPTRAFGSAFLFLPAVFS